MNSKHMDTEDESLIRKHWNSMAVFTDAWTPDVEEHNVPEEELLPGELSAVTFRVGCYTVRSAQRVYKIYEPGYNPELEMPADQDEVEQVRKDAELENAEGIDGYSTTRGISVMYPSWRDKLRLTHEISARHNSDPDDAFKYICRTLQARNESWCEYIGDIYAVKEHHSIPDEYASLLIYSHYEGSSFGVDTWYKLAPTGKITKLELHPFSSKREEAQFV